MVLAGRPSSERALGDDDHVPRHQHDIGGGIALLEQIAQAHGIFALTPGLLVEADQFGAVARRIFAEPADRDHRIEQGHVGAVGDRSGLFGRPDDPHLLELERQAREQGRGLWALQPDQRVPPWEWRKMRRSK